MVKPTSRPVNRGHADLVRVRAAWMGASGSAVQARVAALTMLAQGLEVAVKAGPGPQRLIRGVDAVMASLAQGHE